jgi:hypothetical protein
MGVIYNASMYTKMRHRNVVHWTWIACLAILFNAFAPVLSHAMGAQAMAGAPAMPDMEVCTAMGIEMRPLASSEPNGPDKLQKNTKTSMSHCAYCVAHVPAHGMPPPMPAVFAHAAGRAIWPPLYYQSSRSLFPWALAQPRAPPVRAWARLSA